MKRSLLALLLAAPAWAALALVPTTSSTLNLVAGQTSGWGFQFTITPGDTNFYVLTAAPSSSTPNTPNGIGIEFCATGALSPCPVSLGPGVLEFTDIAYLVNGLVFDIIGTYFPYGPTGAVQPYNASPLEGLLQVTVDPSASAQVVVGEIRVHYEIWDGDPAGGGTQTFASQTLVVPATIAISAAVPEPSAVVLSGLGLAAVAWARRRRAVRS